MRACPRYSLSEKWGDCPQCGLPRTQLFVTPKPWRISRAVCLPCWTDRAAEDPENANYARIFDELQSVLTIFRDVVLRHQNGGK